MLRYTVIMVTKNLTRVNIRIKKACERSGRDPGSVRLIAVTKEATAEEVKEILDNGVTDIGENRVKEALLKQSLLNSHVPVWHMIGHLQSNKAKAAVRLFSVIHSVDSIKSLYTIATEAKKASKTQDCLIEVNISGEETKFGIKPESLSPLLKEARSLKNISVLGLMMMAPFTKDPETVRVHFRKLKELRDKHSLKELSMGMTQDFEVAIEEGATMVRIGSAIFKG